MNEQPLGRLAHTGHLIRRAQQLHVALWNREVSTEVSSVQYAALAVIAAADGISQRELGEAMDLDRSTIADLVERMQRRGLLNRERSHADRRQMVLTITDDGEGVLRDFDPRVQRVEEALTAALSTDERDSLRELLATMLTARE